MDIEKHPWTECCVSEPNCPNLIMIGLYQFFQSLGNIVVMVFDAKAVSLIHRMGEGKKRVLRKSALVFDDPLGAYEQARKVSALRFTARV